MTKKKDEIEVTEDKITDVVEDETRLTNTELASELVGIMSHELHIRVGIGPIWRQLNNTRKQEIINAWEHKAENLLNDER